MLKWKNPVIAFAANGVEGSPSRPGDCILDRYGHVGNMAPPSRHLGALFPRRTRPPTERHIRTARSLNDVVLSTPLSRALDVAGTLGARASGADADAGGGLHGQAHRPSLRP